MTVLIVDENQEIATCFSEPFIGSYDVCVCTNKNSAIKLLFELQPDALIIDLAILIKLKPLPFCPKVIITVACFVTDNAMQKAAAEGVQEVILLPCKADHLLKRVNARLHPTNKELVQPHR